MAKNSFVSVMPALVVLLFCANAEAARFKTVFAIPGFNDGADPTSALIEVGGVLYGTSAAGGASGVGTVFRVDPATGTETTIHDFVGGADGMSPAAPLIVYHGMLYGTTSLGGANEAGTVFRVDPATGTETVIFSFAGFPGDYQPLAPLVAFRGALYGTTALGGTLEDGTIFKIDPETGVETSLYEFGKSGLNDGEAPLAGMIVVGNLLYGTTELGGASSRGTIFTVDPVNGTENVVLDFKDGDAGELPQAPLLAVGGLLYGTGNLGGAQGFGTVFSFDPGKNKVVPVYAFTGGADGGFPTAGLIEVSGTLYGTSEGSNGAGNGTIFGIDVATGVESTLHTFAGGNDGALPSAALLDVNGLLFGTTQAGGFTNNGVAFSVDPATKVESVLHDFAGSENSSAAALVNVKGTLYGTASGGGAFGYGAVFGVNTKTGAGNVLYSFAGGNDGMRPAGALIEIGGVLYGTTSRGGAADAGMVFKLDPATGGKTELYSFTAGGDGGYPYAGLTRIGATLYGTASGGGVSGAGTVFSINPTTGAEATVFSFTGGKHGANPYAPLISANGMLYGTTLNGGMKNNGVVYSIDPATGAYATLYAFQGGADGSTPFAPVTSAGGLLYSTTSGFGRKITDGTLFSLDPTTGIETVLLTFTRHTGTMPLGGVIDVGGVLYGTTGFEGPSGNGTVFSYDLATSTEKTLHAFTGGTDSGIPQASLLQVGDRLFGTTTSETPADAGTVFTVKR